jgi:hypothetical protein
MDIDPVKADASLKEIKEDIKTNQARTEANHLRMMAKLDAHQFHHQFHLHNVVI